MSEDVEQLRARLAEVEAELERVRLTLDVIGTMDLDAAILNRNGILEALDRGRRWMARRGDIYGLLIVEFPGLQTPASRDPEHIELIKHLAATIAAGVREVDDVGRVDDQRFAAVLADLTPGSVRVVADRVRDLVGIVVRSLPEVGGVFRVGAVEVLNTTHTSGAVLDRGVETAQRAAPGDVAVARM